MDLRRYGVKSPRSNGWIIDEETAQLFLHPGEMLPVKEALRNVYLRWNLPEPLKSYSVDCYASGQAIFAQFVITGYEMHCALDRCRGPVEAMVRIDELAEKSIVRGLEKVKEYVDRCLEARRVL